MQRCQHDNQDRGGAEAEGDHSRSRKRRARSRRGDPRGHDRRRSGPQGHDALGSRPREKVELSLAGMTHDLATCVAHDHRDAEHHFMVGSVAECAARLWRQPSSASSERRAAALPPATVTASSSRQLTR